MKSELPIKQIVSSLTDICTQPRRKPDDALLEILARIHEIESIEKRDIPSDAIRLMLDANVLRPKLLRWALENQIHEVVALALCRPTEDSMKAMQGIFKAATKPEVIAHSWITSFGQFYHKRDYGWLQQGLFGTSKDANRFISIDEAVFLAGVAACGKRQP